MRIPLDLRLERLTAWLERANDRPLIGFSLGSYYPLERYSRGVKSLRNGPVRPDDIVVGGYLEDSDRLYELHEQAGGDFIFSAAPFFGIPWVEAALGCGVVADHQAGSTRSVPPASFAEHPVIPQFSEKNPWVAKMLEFIPALSARSGGRYPVGVTLMRGVSDLLSALYGASDFVYRMTDEPDEVRDVVAALTEFWIAFGRSLLEHLPLFHGGTGSFLYNLWCPGKMIWLQEDAVALLSPALYEEFILPADQRIATAFEHTVMHLHPTRLIPTRQLAGSRLAAIELHIDHDGPRAAALEPHYRTVLDTKPLLIWGDVTEADLEFILTKLPHAGLAVNIAAGSVEEAERLWDRAFRFLAG